MNPRSKRVGEWFARKRATPDPCKPIFFIHVMRTAGTSFREMLEEHFDLSEVYPTDEAIKQRGRYPNLTELLDEQSQVLASRLGFGHLPLGPSNNLA